MALGRIPVSITLPAEVLEEIDKLAQEWLSDRSNTIKRVYLEWKQTNLRQLPALTALAPTEAPAIPETEAA